MWMIFDVSVPDGRTLPAGPVADQAALHGLPVRVRDLNLTLISINPLDNPLDAEPAESNEEGER
jgi:hypothetical protein